MRYDFYELCPLYTQSTHNFLTTRGTDRCVIDPASFYYYLCSHLHLILFLTIENCKMQKYFQLRMKFKKVCLAKRGM